MNEYNLSQYITYWNSLRLSVFDKNVTYYTNSMSPSLEFTDQILNMNF